LLIALLVVSLVYSQGTGFSDLAKSYVPKQYNAMLPLVDTLTDKSTPANVYALRKALLTTRDMLDCFSPAFPSVTDGVDLWELLRGSFDEGYTLVGDFQDLDHSKVNYTQTDLDQKRGACLDWKERFQQLVGQYDVDAFLDAPGETSFKHAKESSFYWKKVAQRPAGMTDGIKSIQYLVWNQINGAVGYFDQVVPMTDPIVTANHEIFHDFRKNLRGISDEYKVFGRSIFPQADAANVFTLMGQSRDKIGEVNDQITAYYYYQQKGETSQLPALRQTIMTNFNAFKAWADQVTLRDQLTDFEADLPNRLRPIIIHQ